MWSTPRNDEELLTGSRVKIGRTKDATKASFLATGVEEGIEAPILILVLTSHRSELALHSQLARAQATRVTL
jgi:hypothetical protein